VNQLMFGIGCKFDHTSFIFASLLLTSSQLCCRCSIVGAGEYQDHDTQLPLLIDPNCIVGQLAMTTVSVGENRTKVCFISTKYDQPLTKSVVITCKLQKDRLSLYSLSELTSSALSILIWHEPIMWPSKYIIHLRQTRGQLGQWGWAGLVPAL
jgi:hypothetical protein